MSVEKNIQQKQKNKKTDNITDKLIYQLGRGFNKGGLHNICPTLSSHSWEQNNFLVEIYESETESEEQ